MCKSKITSVKLFSFNSCHPVIIFWNIFLKDSVNRFGDIVSLYITTFLAGNLPVPTLSLIFAVLSLHVFNNSAVNLPITHPGMMHCVKKEVHWQRRD